MSPGENLASFELAAPLFDPDLRGLQPPQVFHPALQFVRELFGAPVLDLGISQLRLLAWLERALVRNFVRTVLSFAHWC